MNIDNYNIGFLNAPDITGVLIFLAVKYGCKHEKENYVPYYKRNDLKFKDYGKKYIYDAYWWQEYS